MPRQQFGVRVDPDPIDPANFNNKTLLQDEEITIWSEQVPADKAFVWGVGPNDRDAGDANYIYAEFLASGAGAGTDGDVIQDGKLIAAITDSTQEDTIAKTTIGDLEDLYDAKSDARTERPVFPEHAPGASEDRHIELRLKVGSTSDGKELANDGAVKLNHGVVG